MPTVIDIKIANLAAAYCKADRSAAVNVSPSVRR